MYERERLEYFPGIEPEDLDPYPGFFLRDDLEFKAASVCLNYATRALKRKKQVFYLGHMKNLEILFNKAPRYAQENAPRFLKFKTKWEKLMKTISKDKELFKHFNRF